MNHKCTQWYRVIVMGAFHEVNLFPRMIRAVFLVLNFLTFWFLVLFYHCLLSSIAVMECWSRCSSYESAIKADELFKDLKQVHESMENHSSGFLQESARVQPSAYTYTTLIKAWSRAAATSNSIAPRRAEEILDELLAISVPKQQQSHPSNPNFLVIPNAVPFTAVLQCWAQSKHVPDKATKALELLKRMKSLAASMNNPSLLPTLATYNTAIDVCGRCGDVIANIQSPSSSKNQLAALQIAIAILRAIEVEGQRKDANNSTTLSFQPNAATYGKLLRAVGSLLPSGAERNKVATAVFKKAIAAGQVDMSVVRNLQKAADVEVIREFFPESGITVQNGHASNERDKIESRILQRNQGVALNTRQNSSNKGGKQFVNPESIPPAWSKNVGRIQ